MAKMRLVSLNGLEIAVSGIESSFTDALLTGHPHKVATISVPFCDKTVIEFAKTVANPGKQIRKGVAQRIAAVYRILGVEIDVTDNDNGESDIVSIEARLEAEPTTSLVTTGEEFDADGEDGEEFDVDGEDAELKFIIKVEIEQQGNTSENNTEFDEEANPCKDLPSTSQQQPADILPNGESKSEPRPTQPADLNQSSVFSGQNVLPSPPPPSETGQVRREVNASQHTQESLETGDTSADGTILHLEQNTSAEIQENDEQVDDNCVDVTEADFSFHDLEIDAAQKSLGSLINSENNTLVTQTMTINLPNVVGTVVNRIIQAAGSPSEVTIHTSSVPGSQDKNPQKPRPDILSLRFVKAGVFPIRDIAKKRKRKRGQN